MSKVIINGTEVRISEDGLYSLNDLHKSSGGERKHQVPNFLRHQTTKEIIAELCNSSHSRSYKDIINKTAGRYGGTWVCKELVYSYGMWVSAKFQLRVINTFDAVASGDMHKAVAVASNDKRLLSIISKRDAILSSKVSAGKKADKLCLLEQEWSGLMSGAGKTLAIGRGQPMLFKQAEEQVLSEIQDNFEF